MIYLLQFTVSFISVFLKGFQHQNVIGGHYRAAFFVSYLMAGFEVLVITLIIQTGYWAILTIGAGASLGIVSSMYIYRRFNITVD
tara:strand:+ start:387 stop:641 length:255 start_codon:yes stop_codon:yes gene_type:complete